MSLICLVSLSAVLILRHRTVLAPSVFTATLVGGYATLSVVGFGWDALSIVCVAVLTLSVATIAAGDEIGLQSLPIRQNKRILVTNWYIWKACAVSSLGLAAFHILSTIVIEGYSVRAMFRLDGLLQMATEFSHERYHGSYRSPLLARVTLPFVFLAPLLVGSLLGARQGARRTRKLWLIAALMPALAIALIKTEKWPLVCSLVYCGAAFLAYRHVVKGERIPIGRYALLGIVAFLALVAIALFSSMLRLGEFTDGSIEVGREKVLSTVSSLVVLSSWLDSHSFGFQMDWGVNTFAGIADIIGIDERLQGLYSGFVRLPNGQYSNVYTVLRPLIEDFSILGAMLCLFLMGFVWRLALRERYLALSAFMMSATVLGVINTSIFVHNSLPLAFVLFALNVFVCRRSGVTIDERIEPQFAVRHC